MTRRLDSGRRVGLCCAVRNATQRSRREALVPPLNEPLLSGSDFECSFGSKEKK